MIVRDRPRRSTPPAPTKLFVSYRSMTTASSPPREIAARDYARRGVLSQQAMKSARSPHVDHAFRQRGQLGVGLLFLIERLLQQAGAIVAPELTRPRDQAAVAGDLIMFGGLGGVDQG